MLRTRLLTHAPIGTVTRIGWNGWPYGPASRAETGSFAGSPELRTSDTSASFLEVVLRSPYPYAAKTLMRRQSRGDAPAVEAVHDAVDEVQVHAADQLGVLRGELVERAVRQADLVIVDPRLITQRLQRLCGPAQLCLDSGRVARTTLGPGGSCAGRLDQPPATRPGSGPDRLRQRLLL